jgi:hypothetical protein
MFHLNHGVYGLIGHSSLRRNSHQNGLSPQRIHNSWIWTSRIYTSGSTDRRTYRSGFPPCFLMLQPCRFPPVKCFLATEGCPLAEGWPPIELLTSNVGITNFSMCDMEVE